ASVLTVESQATYVPGSPPAAARSLHKRSAPSRPPSACGAIVTDVTNTTFAAKVLASGGGPPSGDPHESSPGAWHSPSAWHSRSPGQSCFATSQVTEHGSMPLGL